MTPAPRKQETPPAEKIDGFATFTVERQLRPKARPVYRWRATVIRAGGHVEHTVGPWLELFEFRVESAPIRRAFDASLGRLYTQEG